MYSNVAELVISSLTIVFSRNTNVNFATFVSLRHFEKVEKERVKDAAEGNLIAQILEGKVSRKVVKQTVMTTVYGVTRFGARLQIAKQLKG